MSKWLDLARETGAPRANSANSANSSPFGTNGTNGTASLPPSVAMGMRRLKAMAPPARFPNWPGIVADADRVITEGWAESALRLGWSAVHLWGWSEDRAGLAAWLGGRRVAMLDSDSAIVLNSDGSRSQWNRRPMPGAVMLWEVR